MVQIKGLKIRVKNFTLDVPPVSFRANDKVLVTGNNGAGKTVFLYALVGLVKECAGSVYIQGVSVQKDGWQKNVGVYLDEYFLIPYFTPAEFFSYVGKLRGVRSSDIDDVINEAKEDLKFELTTQLIRDLSSGNRKKVGLISTLIGEPKVLIWDEPFANLDGESKNGLCSIIQKLQERILLFSEHISSVLEVPHNRKLVIDQNGLKELI